MFTRMVVIVTALLVAAAAGVEAGIPSGTVQRQILARHNKVRAKYGAKPLTWSGTIARSANSFTQRCSFAHDANALVSMGYGENLSMGTTTWAQSINLWLNEAGSYSSAKPVFASDTGHFTQVVWKKTKKVGCGMTHCGGGAIWSCRYYPAGNYAGQFSANVGK